MDTARGRRIAAVALTAALSSATSGAVNAAPEVLQKSTIKNVSVQASKEWTNTGIRLEEGQTFAIDASGTVKIAASDPGKTPNGEQGCTAGEGWLVPDATCYSLVGFTADNEPQEIDDYGEYYAKSTGYLYLGVNDE